MNYKKLITPFVLVLAVVASYFIFSTKKPNQVVNSSFTGSVKTFLVDGSSYKYEPNVINVNKGDLVKITFKDIDGTHNLVIDGYKVSSKVLSSGKEENIEFVADKTGSFKFYCSLPGHKDKGMVGTLIVN